jgi:hypothetical protein
MRVVLLLLAVTLALGAFTEQEIEDGKMRTKMRDAIKTFGVQRGIADFSQAKEALRAEVANAPVGTFSDRVMMDKHIRESDTSDVNLQGTIALGTATPSIGFSGSNFYVYAFTVPAADSSMSLAITVTGSFGSFQNAGIILGLNRAIYDETDRYQSQWFFSLNSFTSPYTMGSCAYKPYAGTTGYVWFYKSSSLSSWPSGVSFTLTATAATCTLVPAVGTGALTSWNFANITATGTTYLYAQFTYANTQAQRITITATPAPSDSSKLVIAGGNTGATVHAPGNGSPQGGYITNGAASTVTVGYRPDTIENGNTIRLWATTATYTCSTLNLAQVNSTCPQLTANMKYGRTGYGVTIQLAFLDLQAFILGGGACATGVIRTLTCTALFPQCDANDFVLPICTSLCSDYATCNGYQTQDKCFGYMQAQLADNQDNNRSPNNQQYEAVVLMPAAAGSVTVGTNCWRYPFNSASVAGPSFFVVAAVAALLALAL